MPPPEISIGPEFDQCLSWADVFGNERPVELEIGTGKAGFLLRRAQAHPELNFVGIEWANKFYRFAVDRMQRWKMINVRLLRTDASHFIRAVCPRDSLTALHVYHPDPWPKLRHHKRRLFQDAFIDAAAHCLLPRGRWAIQTDHAEYAGVIRRRVLAHPLLEETDFDDANFGVEGSAVATNYEIKYLREGRRLYRLAVVRIRAWRAKALIRST